MIFAVFCGIIGFAALLTGLEAVCERVEDRVVVRQFGVEGMRKPTPVLVHFATRTMLVDVPLSMFAIVGCQLPPALFIWLIPIVVGRLMEARSGWDVFGGPWAVGKILWIVPLVVAYGFPLIGATANLMLGRHH